jgi:hypothetical protein
LAGTPLLSVRSVGRRCLVAPTRLAKAIGDGRSVATADAPPHFHPIRPIRPICPIRIPTAAKPSLPPKLFSFLQICFFCIKPIFPLYLQGFFEVKPPIFDQKILPTVRSVLFPTHAIMPPMNAEPLITGYNKEEGTAKHAKYAKNPDTSPPKQIGVRLFRSAIYENSAFSTKFFPLCFLCFLLFRFFGCGLPRQVFRGSRNCLGEDFGRAVATLRLCVESSSPVTPVTPGQTISLNLTMNSHFRGNQWKCLSINNLHIIP